MKSVLFVILTALVCLAGCETIQQTASDPNSVAAINTAGQGLAAAGTASGNSVMAVIGGTLLAAGTLLGAGIGAIAKKKTN